MRLIIILYLILVDIFSNLYVGHAILAVINLLDLKNQDISILFRLVIIGLSYAISYIYNNYRLKSIVYIFTSIKKHD